MEPNITPPIEYPKIYEINFLQKGTVLRKIDPISQDVVNEIAIQLRDIKNISLNVFLNRFDILYRTFIGSLPIKISPHGYTEDPKDDFFSYEIFKNDLNDIEDTSREGDLVTIIIPSLKYKNDIYKVYYISGFGENRKIQRLWSDLIPEGYLLPENGINVVNSYNIITKEDINKIYPDLDIVGYVKDDDIILFK